MRQLKQVDWPIFRLPAGTLDREEGWLTITTAKGTLVVHPPLGNKSVAQARFEYKLQEDSTPWAFLEAVLHYSGLFVDSATYITASGQILKFTKKTYYPVASAKLQEHGSLRTSRGFYVQVLGYPCRFYTDVAPDMCPIYASIANTDMGPILLGFTEAKDKSRRIKL